ncbi:PAS domain-containing sensor histidine kinase [Rufibacter immobilis]|nr:PAS domain-containing sensor histidine kinase [Rufibacter immobilis]
MDPLPSSLPLCHALIEQTGQPFFIYDMDTGQFQYLSPKLKSSFGLEAGQLLPGDLLSFVHPEDQEFVANKFTELLTRGLDKPIEFRVQFPEKQEQWVCLSPSLQEEISRQRLLIGHAADITAERQNNDVLKKYSNKKNSILNILAHDLAGPLGMIKSLANLLTEKMRETAEEENLHILNLIERNSSHGANIIRQFTDQEFLESSQVELVTRRVNLVQKLREGLEVYLGPEGELISKRVAFNPQREVIFVEIDDNKFLQAINNLISNALKFTPDGSDITVSVAEEAGHVLVTVADTGIGIPQKYHATLFEKFTDARRPGLQGEQSVGLGMSIIKNIVEWHCGEIWFESEEDKGTTFFIRLPQE